MERSEARERSWIARSLTRGLVLCMGGGRGRECDVA